MFKSTLTALALTAAVAVPPTAHATWFDASTNCQSIDEMFRALGWKAEWGPIPHTPTEIVANRRFSVRDVTDQFPHANPNVLRMLDFGGPHGIHMFTNDQGTCYEVLATKRPHPSPVR
jgi:hypothetical protein